MAKTILTAEQRFMAKVLKAPGGCWIWTGPRMKSGYGRFYDRRIFKYTGLAHRAAWMLYFGSPSGKTVCHHCDNPPCVNPEHLFLSDDFGNCDDMAKKSRGTKSSAGLPYGVRKDWNRFQVQVQYRNKRYYGGSFRTAEEAASEALAIKRRLRTSPSTN